MVSSHRGLERTDEIIDAENGAVLDVGPVAGELVDKLSYDKRCKLYQTQPPHGQQNVQDEKPRRRAPGTEGDEQCRGQPY